MNKSPIGVFDSGLGGLTVLKEIMRMLPNENIIYFGKLSYCHNLKKIYLPNRSITIGLFSYLDNLEELHLGGAKNFVCSERMYSENLRLITVSGNNEYLYTIYNQRGDEIDSGWTEYRDIELYNSVNSYIEYVLKYCDSISAIVKIEAFDS